MTIGIAKSKTTLLHYFLRVIPSDSVENVDFADASFVNALTTAKSHKQLVASIEHVGLLAGRRGTDKQPPRVMSPQECVEALANEFEPVDAKLLAREMFMASPRTLRANSGKMSPAAVYDAYSSGMAEEVLTLTDEYAVVVEPVQDWMTFRNMLSIEAALLAGIVNPPETSDALSLAGALRVEKSALGVPVYVIPFKFFAAVFGTDFARHPVKSSSLRADDSDYLYSRYLSGEAKTNWKGGAPMVDTTGLGGRSDIFFLTRYNLKEYGITPLDLVKVPVEKNTLLYLCVVDGGDPEDAAKRVVEALWAATQTLKDTDGSPLGLVLDLQDLFVNDLKSPKMVCRSLLSKAFYTLCYHGNSRRLISCKYCRSGVLAAKRGPAKEFCSDSCRMRQPEYSCAYFPPSPPEGGGAND